MHLEWRMVTAAWPGCNAWRLVVLQTFPPCLNSVQQADGRQCIHITVRDTGIGIDSDAMSKLFRSFQQAHESMSRKYGGTGENGFSSLRRDTRGQQCS